MSKVSAIFRDVSTFGKSKVSKAIIELLVTAGTGEFKLGSETYVDSRIDWLVNTFGSF